MRSHTHQRCRLNTATSYNNSTHCFHMCRLSTVTSDDRTCCRGFWFPEYGTDFRMNIHCLRRVWIQLQSIIVTLTWASTLESDEIIKVIYSKHQRIHMATITITMRHSQAVTLQYVSLFTREGSYHG